MDEAADRGADPAGRTQLTRLSRSVSGSVVLVTGAASGMGRATAFVFAEQGARVAVCDLDRSGVEETCGRIEAAGGEAIPLVFDVVDRAAGEDAVGTIRRHWDRLDILINNAGISARLAIDGEGYFEVWERTLAVVLSAQAAMVRAALPLLRRAPHPRIVNIASTEGLGATPGISAYTAAKHGVVGLTRSLAVELGREGITVNCICPGPIDTAMTAAIPDDQKQTYARRRTALGRYGSAEEVAQMTLSCCLPAASFLTGASIVVDGGLTVRRA
ncbi:MAG: SDR family NAD(P)-dependent oxidoreductase [Acidobacteria bacterium]|nr:MAG: SDR family NAD(P)-dependent oxidoreductase [Acidobacteriota bacterium]REK00133.1 MAG: SDR family NAD(P)-dependent oxidoreductase [Acidobacteriota bacterium]